MAVYALTTNFHTDDYSGPTPLFGPTRNVQKVPDELLYKIS
jgi:hypothetical protein